MFKKKNEKIEPFVVEVQPPKVMPSTGEERTFIGKEVLIKGEVMAEEDMIVEGRVEGKIETKKSLIVGKNGNIEAEIKANQVKIMGKVKGDVHATMRIEIVPTGALFGNIASPRVSISEGAIFKGNIDMHRTEKESEKVEGKKAKEDEKKSSS